MPDNYPVPSSDTSQSSTSYLRGLVLRARDATFGSTLYNGGSVTSPRITSSQAPAAAIPQPHVTGYDFSGAWRTVVEDVANDLLRSSELSSGTFFGYGANTPLGLLFAQGSGNPYLNFILMNPEVSKKLNKVLEDMITNLMGAQYVDDPTAYFAIAQYLQGLARSGGVIVGGALGGIPVTSGRNIQVQAGMTASPQINALDALAQLAQQRALSVGADIDLVQGFRALFTNLVRAYLDPINSATVVVSQVPPGNTVRFGGSNMLVSPAAVYGDNGVSLIDRETLLQGRVVGIRKLAAIAAIALYDNLLNIAERDQIENPGRTQQLPSTLTGAGSNDFPAYIRSFLAHTIGSASGLADKVFV